MEELKINLHNSISLINGCALGRLYYFCYYFCLILKNKEESVCIDQKAKYFNNRFKRKWFFEANWFLSFCVCLEERITLMPLQIQCAPDIKQMPLFRVICEGTSCSWTQITTAQFVFGPISLETLLMRIKRIVIPNVYQQLVGILQF